MMWRSIDFVWAAGVGLMLTIPLLIGAYYYLERDREKRLEQFGDYHVLSSLMIRRSRLIFWAKVLLLSIVLVCGIGALMQPRGNPRLPSSSGLKQETVSEQKHRRHDLLFLVDVSASMETADSGEARSQRLDNAKELVDAVISQLRGENISLTAFTSVPLPIVPLTTDYLFTRLMLRDLKINEGNTAGTDLIKALESAESVFDKTSNAVAKTLIVVTDGDVHLSAGIARTKQLEMMRSVSSRLKEKGIHLIAIGVGSLKGAAVPGIKYRGESVDSAQEPEVLERIASPERYYNANLHSILWVAQKVGKNIESHTIVQTSQENMDPRQVRGAFIYDYYFQYPLIFALVALGLFLTLPDTTKRRLLVEQSQEGGI